MLKKGIFVLFVFLAAGCSSIGAASGRISQLTPYYTETAIVEESITEAAPEPVIITPAPTATPRIHIVALNDTISSIALQYGVTIDAIQKANPDVESTLLIVGDEVVIPGGETTLQSGPDPALIESLHFSVENCNVTGEGLWCGALLKNMSGVDLELPIVTFSLADSNGEVISTINVPAVMRMLPVDGEIPVAAFFEDMPAGYDHVEVELFSVEYAAADGTDRQIVVEESTITLDGLTGTISGNLRIDADDESESSDMTIAAVGLDADGEPVGIRRVDSNVVVGESVPFEIMVYSTGRDIADINLFTEAY